MYLKIYIHIYIYMYEVSVRSFRSIYLMARVDSLVTVQRIEDLPTPPHYFLIVMWVGNYRNVFAIST